MRITSQEEYGLRCLLELARSKTSLTITERAKRGGISTAYVGKLFFLLRRSRLVASLRGAKGGYVLAGDPRVVTLAEVLTALGGPKKEEDICQRFPGTKRECVHIRGSCSVRSVWHKVYENIWKMLDTTTLGDLLNEEGAVTESLGRRFDIKEALPLAVSLGENRGSA